MSSRRSSRSTVFAVPDNSEWLAALAAAQERNRREFILGVIDSVGDSLFAVGGLAGAVYLISTGRALGLFLALAGANLANVRQFVVITRGWLRGDDEPEAGEGS